MPFFSVVIPLYNKENFIEATIQSVLSQTFGDYEIIVVDDCSTDRSLDIVARFNHDKIKVVKHEKNSGLSASRNTGIKTAVSDHIAYIDADDTWAPFFLEKMHELIQKFPAAGLYASGYSEIRQGNQVLNIQKDLGMAPGAMQLIDDFFVTDTQQPILWYGCAVVRKEVFDTVGGFDTAITYGEDTDFNIRAGQKFKLAYYNAVCASYTIDSQNQITRSLNGRTITDFDKYEADARQNPSLKKFLDVNRYFLAAEYRLIGNEAKYAALVSGINFDNLTKKQKFILRAPVNIVRLLRKIKKILLRKGIRLTTFTR